MVRTIFFVRFSLVLVNASVAEGIRNGVQTEIAVTLQPGT